LDIGVLVAYAPFEGAHGFFRLHCLGADYVRDFEVERDILAIESISSAKCTSSRCCAGQTYRLEAVAFSIWPSSSLFDELNQPAMCVEWRK
jgi:hypothetical protein